MRGEARTGRRREKKKVTKKNMDIGMTEEKRADDMNEIAKVVTILVSRFIAPVVPAHIKLFSKIFPTIRVIFRQTVLKLWLL